jgi:hypothetical protein
MAKIVAELELCDNCMIAAVNGDMSGVPDGAPEPLHKLDTMVVHACPDCTTGDSHATRPTTCPGCGDEVDTVHGFVIFA